jgi:archaellum component FlaC
MEFLNGYIKQLKTDPSVKASKIDQIMDRLEEERAFNKNILVMLKGIEKVVADRGSKLNKLAYAIEEIRNKENYCQN